MIVDIGITFYIIERLRPSVYKTLLLIKRLPFLIKFLIFFWRVSYP